MEIWDVLVSEKVLAGDSNSDNIQSRSGASDLPHVILSSKVIHVSMSQLLFHLDALFPTVSIACRVGGTTWPYSTGDMPHQMSHLCSSCFLTSYTDPFLFTRLHLLTLPDTHLRIIYREFSAILPFYRKHFHW